MNTGLRRTALYETHVGHKARLVPFAGWEMPVQYSGVLAEVNAVRTGLGLFDVSHMGRLRIAGPDALAFVARIVASNPRTLADGGGQYSLL
ncbi:MAG: glycine cleavage system protein T, partial [Armatimonadaceae bacterium]